MATSLGLRLFEFPVESTQTINKTLDFCDLQEPQVRATANEIKRWVWRWLLKGEPLGVNGRVKRRFYIRRHKMWEYARGLALTNTSARTRSNDRPLTVLDIGGAMTAPVFYLAGLGDSVVCLDIDQQLTDRTNTTAARRQLRIDARTTNLVDDDPSAADLGVDDGFDRVFCFCVIEHVPAPGQTVLAQRMAALVKPGGMLAMSFDFGEDAPSEAPLRTTERVDEIRSAIGLPLMGNDAFVDTGSRHRLDRRYPDRLFTFGSMFFQRPQ